MSVFRNAIVLSQYGIASQCEIVFGDRGISFSEFERTESALRQLKFGSPICLDIGVLNDKRDLSDVEDVVDRICSLKKKFIYFVLVEPLLPINILKKLVDSSIRIFIQNNIFENEKIHNLPVGIRDSEYSFPDHSGFSHFPLIATRKTNHRKMHLSLLCYSEWTHTDRKSCSDTLGKLPFVYNLNESEKYPEKYQGRFGAIPYEDFYKELASSHFCLCPRGVGLSSHRFFEAIFLRSIPIVKKTHSVFDKLYNVFPCLVVEDWADVTQNLLEDKLPELLLKMENFENYYGDVFFNFDNLFQLMHEL